MVVYFVKLGLLWNRPLWNFEDVKSFVEKKKLVTEEMLWIIHRGGSESGILSDFEWLDVRKDFKKFYSVQTFLHVYVSSVDAYLHTWVIPLNTYICAKYLNIFECISAKVVFTLRGIFSLLIFHLKQSNNCAAMNTSCLNKPQFVDIAAAVQCH